MSLYLYRLIIYILSLVLAYYGLSAFDYSRFLRANVNKYQARTLYFLLAIALAFLLAQFLMGVMYAFQSTFNLQVS